MSDKKPRIGEESMTPEQKADALSLLAQEPRPTFTEVAREVGANRHAIRRLFQNARPDLEAGEKDSVSDRVLAAYVREFKRISPEERAGVYADIIRGKVDARTAYSRLKALQRVEELEGIVTAKERKEDAAASSGPPVGLFRLEGNVTPSTAASMEVYEAELRAAGKALPRHTSEGEAMDVETKRLPDGDEAA